MTSPLLTLLTYQTILTITSLPVLTQNFKKHKASGPISVPTDILHYLKHDFARPLSWITKISFSTGIHPDRLKVAKLIPIYKKGSKFKTSNYRPICLLSSINVQSSIQIS